MSQRPTLDELAGHDDFLRRHIGTLGAPDQAELLEALGLPSLDALVDEAVPASIRQRGPLDLPPARTEAEVLASLREIAGRNQVLTSLIGMGYYGTITPPVIQRNLLENPAWYTAYTPYQPEISQGRLEALLNFQTMVADLTGMDLANASMLDEATAAAEAMAMARRLAKARTASVFVVDADTHPQTWRCCGPAPSRSASRSWSLPLDGEPLPDGLLRRARLPSGLERAAARLASARPRRSTTPAASSSWRPTCSPSCCSSPPGEWGADIVVGSAQRFGVPHGVRRPARRLPRHSRADGAVAARPPGRRVARTPRVGRPAPRPPDTRAAHPPREGDVEHLHGPGAAGHTSPGCTPCGTGPTGCAASPDGCTGWPRSSPPG